MLFFHRKLAAAVAVLAVANIGVVVYYRTSHPDNADAARYRTAPADVGTITQTVTATGTLNPVALINVGSQVSGTVVELRADFNDHVKKGQVLLKLDPTIFNTQIAQSEATVAAQGASLRLAQANFERNEKLVAQNFVSSLSLDQLRRELDVAKANLALALAQLARAKADLDNSVIRAPIDGIVIKRTIDIGQTVAASFNTPNLFQIAQDLTKMQIDTNVSEADVAQIREGVPARFVVDAYPDREFDATVRQFRLASNVVQNVVTYNVVLDVDNQGELLKPGMTAQVRLLVGNHANVLRIPTSALRFRLSDEELQRQARVEKASLSTSAGAKGGVPQAEDDVSFRSKSETARLFRIYKLDEQNRPEPVDVTIGLSNFRYTEVMGGDLKKGDRVVTRALNGPGGGKP
jgi:HlyD family secretion protein